MAHYRRLHEDRRGDRARQKSRGRDDYHRRSVSPRRRKSKTRSRSPPRERRVESVISRPEKECETTPQVEASPQVEACPQPEIEIEVSPGTRQEVDQPQTDPVSPPLSGKLRGMMELMKTYPRDESESETSGSEADNPGETELANPGQIRRVQIGRPIEELPTPTLLQNQQVRVGELSTQAVYHHGEKVWEESRDREYDVVFLRAGTKDTPRQRMCKLHHVEAGVPGAAMSEGDLTRVLVGRVQKITETVCETTFQEGVVQTKRETRKEYLVDAVAGIKAAS